MQMSPLIARDAAGNGYGFELFRNFRTFSRHGSGWVQYEYVGPLRIRGDDGREWQRLSPGVYRIPSDGPGDGTVVTPDEVEAERAFEAAGSIPSPAS